MPKNFYECEGWLFMESIVQPQEHRIPLVVRTIVLDAGHGGADPGAVANGRMEKVDNLNLARAVQSRLVALGQNVIMTRTTDINVPLEERSAISNRNNADIFVSIHRNASTNPNANGVDNFVHTNASARTFQWAQTVLNEVVSVGVQNDRGVHRANFAVLRLTNAPAMLIEMGFITNVRDNQLFELNFNAYADAITRGILKSLNSLAPPPQIWPPFPGVTLREGMTGPSIRQVQERLNVLGANPQLSEDGIFGPRTANAVRVFQQQRGLNADGIVGLITWNALFGATPPPPPQPPPPPPPPIWPPFPGVILREGMTGPSIRQVQERLNILGANPQLSEDGIFGPRTANAVRVFQQQRGLNADGIVGPITWNALFSPSPTTNAIITFGSNNPNPLEHSKSNGVNINGRNNEYTTLLLLAFMFGTRK